MMPQALAVPQSNPPPSILPFLTAFSIVILVFVSIIIFSILASFAIIIFVYVISQYLIGPMSFDGHWHDLEVGESSQNQITGVLISHQTRHGGDVERSESNIWREILERTMAERKGVMRGQVMEKMAAPVSYGSSEAAGKCIDCAICLEDFENGELCQIFPLCNHIFHYCCIQHWLEKNLTCPICRCSILNEKC